MYPVKEARLIEGTPCAAILSKEPQTEISFEIHKDAEPPSRKQGLLRYLSVRVVYGSNMVMRVLSIEFIRNIAHNG